MMKRLGFLETKRTPRYSMRKLNVGMASILLGVTIFGINFTNHSVKAAATTESVETSATEKGQQNGASNDATQKGQQSSATVTKPTGAAPTLQSALKRQGSADTGTVQNNKPANEKQVATEDKINWGAIKYKISDDNNSRGVEITGWDITKGGYDVVLPNTADFVKRGTITEKQAAYVSGDDLHNIFLTLASKTNNPEGKDFTITISHNKDSKLSDSRLHVKPIYYYQISVIKVI